MGRTVLVTGASRGIGRALVEHLDERGHRVIATCRDHDAVAAWCDAGIPALPLDTTDRESLRALPAAVRALTDHLDVLVNNAGTKHAPGYRWQASAGPMGALDPDAVASVLATNVVGPLMTTQALLPLLTPGGVVANTSSQLGSFARGVGVDYAYNASKAALDMVTVTMQRDLGHLGVTAVAINPGWIRTAMGGGGAPLDVRTATADLADLVGRLDGSYAGRFVDRHGDPHPW